MVAQSILLIESPAQLKYSSVGAYGPFQIMKKFARTMGLTVNRYIDERKDFTKSAFAASELLRTICVPQARRILCEMDDVDPNGDELWFKFLYFIYTMRGLKMLNLCYLNLKNLFKEWN